MRWAYGVTTVQQRFNDLLPRTLASLAQAGFDRPRLFVDGWHTTPERFGHLEATCRTPAVNVYGNWILGLAELYIRNPIANRYAMFQDDLVTCRNLRAYLERSEYPQGYLNLYTFPENQVLAPKLEDGRQKRGWYRSNQMGRGAVALVFSREAVAHLLTHAHMVNRVTDATRGWRLIDGGLSEAMSRQSDPPWHEYVHNPSLVQHTGALSAMGNRPHQQALSFPGEDFDSLELL